MIKIGYWKGKKLSAEHRYHISEARKGKHPWNFGKKLPDEFGEKIRKLAIGKKSIRIDGKKRCLRNVTNEEVFLSWTRRAEGGCLIWEGRNNGVYGEFIHDGIKEGAHRWAYRHFVGPFNESLYICHKCDNPLCVEPTHLWPGTNSENMLDAVAKGRHLGKKRESKP